MATPFKPKKGRGKTVDHDITLVDGGYNVDAINAEYAVVLIGGKVAVISEELITDSGSITSAILSLQGFRDWNLNKYVNLGRDQKRLADVWLSDFNRRQYKGLTFQPGVTGHSNGYYNIWRGFSVEPDPRGDALCQKYLAHIYENVCMDMPDVYDRVIAFFADIVQNPGKKSGMSLVLRGLKGTGKTIVGEIFGRLFPANYMLVDSPHHLFGKFNAHMATCILLQADEGFWAGDHEAEGRLKGMITSPTHVIEKKGYDAISVVNYMRLMITSNSDWVVPVSADERRFIVLDVGQQQMQNHAYFAAIHREMNEDGLGGLLHYLQNFDLNKINLREVLKTPGLMEQKLASMKPVQKWWYDCLVRETVPQSGNSWTTVVFCDTLRSSFQAYCKNWNIRSQIDPRSVGITLKEIVPLIVRQEGRRGDYAEMKASWPADGKRAGKVYRLGDLTTCRTDFERYLGHEIDWKI